MLCLYYLLVIKYNVKDDVLEKCEKYMHAYAVVPTAIIAIIGSSLGMLNPGKLDYCGLGDGCDIIFMEPDPDCQSHHRTLRIIVVCFALCCCMLNLIIIGVSMTLIYLSVHKQAER